MQMATKICIYGVPGTGKTKFSELLGKKLQIPVIEADAIKKKARKNITKNENPFLYLGTCLAYKQFGELSQETARKGLLAVRDALSEAVEREIKHYSKVILEGAFLDPVSIMSFGKALLLTTTNEQKHKKQFLQHQEKIFDFTRKEFKAARIVQDYLITEAKKLDIQIIENDDTLETVVRKCVAYRADFLLSD